MKLIKANVLLVLAVLLFAVALYAATVNGYLDFKLGSAPLNPASGNARVYVDSSTSLMTCLLNSGATCMPGAQSKNLIRPCEIVIGDPGAASSALADDNDSPSVCGNKFGATLTITSVECFADAGSPTVTPILTGGTSTSILSGALTCGTGSFASGTLNGTPTESSGASIDGNITTAGGTAKYIVIRITRTL